MDAAWDPQRNYQWVWDTCFMVLYCRYGAGQYPGIESLDNFYELQRNDGYISMTYDLNTGEEPWPDRINPPLFAWVEWEYYRTTGDSSRFVRVVPHIEKLMEWIDSNRRTAPHRRRTAGGDGERLSSVNDENYQLYYFKDCGSSGMDDSPRTPRYEGAGGFFDWIDLSSQMVLSFRMLARMHEVLGHVEQAEKWKSRAESAGDLINDEMWCERTAFFHDRSLPNNFVGHKTAAGFWPILAGICENARLDALVSHLQNKDEFSRPMPVPSLSADDCNYSPAGTYWLGGVWAPTNYMITRGLMQAGRGDAAHDIAVKYLDALVRTYDAIEPHTLWECYSPETDAPGLSAGALARVKPDFVGWTGLGPIAMLMENILGIDLDVPRGRLTWDIRLTCEHGIRDLPVGGGKLDLSCAERGSSAGSACVTARASTPLLLHVRRGDKESSMHLASGRTETVSV